jgi:hypothetical protein
MNTLEISASDSPVQPPTEIARKRSLGNLAELGGWITSGKRRWKGPDHIGLNLEVEELDLIADYAGPMEVEPGHHMRMHLTLSLGDHDVYHFMDSLEWWREFAFEFLVSFQEQDNGPDIEDHREKLLLLYRGVLSAYLQTIGDDIVHGDFDIESRTGFVAVRAYRLFTREVCLVAQSLYPLVDLKPLLDRS